MKSSKKKNILLRQKKDKTTTCVSIGPEKMKSWSSVLSAVSLFWPSIGPPRKGSNQRDEEFTPLPSLIEGGWERGSTAGCRQPNLGSWSTLICIELVLVALLPTGDQHLLWGPMKIHRHTQNSDLGVGTSASVSPASPLTAACGVFSLRQCEGHMLKTTCLALRDFVGI